MAQGLHTRWDLLLVERPSTDRGSYQTVQVEQPVLQYVLGRKSEYGMERDAVAEERIGARTAVVCYPLIFDNELVRESSELRYTR